MASDPPKSYYNDEFLSDVTIHFCSEKIYAHKIILARHSHVFGRAFKSALPVSHSRTFDMGDEYSAHAIRAVIRHMYGIDWKEAWANETPAATSMVAPTAATAFNFYIEVFAVANQYNIPSLGRDVAGNLTDLIERIWMRETDAFVDGCRHIVLWYHRELVADPMLYKTVVDFCSRRSRGLHKMGVFKAMLDGLPHRAVQRFKADVKAQGAIPEGSGQGRAVGSEHSVR